MKAARMIIFIGCLFGMAAAADMSAKEKAAVSAAEKWLNLVDQGKYSESWEQSALLFQSAVTPEQWKQAMNSGRRPLGNLLSRKVTSAHYATELPGAPDGEYVVIRFETSFVNKKSAMETVTPMMNPDSTWRVSGYYIK